MSIRLVQSNNAENATNATRHLIHGIHAGTFFTLCAIAIALRPSVRQRNNAKNTCSSEKKTFEFRVELHRNNTTTIGVVIVMLVHHLHAGRNCNQK